MSDPRGYIDIIPSSSHESVNGLELRDNAEGLGNIIEYGEWVKRKNMWVLRIPNHKAILGAEIAGLKAELAAAQKDAERLDWCQENISLIRDIGFVQGRDIREAIDAAKD